MRNVRIQARAVPLSLLLATGCAPSLSLEGSYGRLDARGEVAVADSGTPLVTNRLADMGIEGRDSSPGARVDLRWGSPHLTLATQSASWSGEGRATEFGAITGTNVGVRSDLDLGLHRGILTFDIFPGSTFDLGLGFGVSAVDIDARVVDPLTSRREEIDEVVPIPVLAARLGACLWRIELEALVSGLAVRLDGDKATYLDADLAARLRFLDLGRVDGLLSVGYRRVAVDVEYEDDGDDGRFDFTLDGPYAGLRIRF